MTSESAAAQRELGRLVSGRTPSTAAGLFQQHRPPAPTLVRGEGARVLDVDGTWYVEYGMGMGAVTLGYGYFPVVRSVTEAAIGGTSFTSANVWELEAAQHLVDQVPGAEMVRFTNNSADATTAAVRLARAATGRDLVAVAVEQAGLSGGIAGVPALDGGIADLTERNTVTFKYGDLNSVHALLARCPGRIAAIFLAAATATAEPPPEFLPELRALADRHGVVLIFDESLTGMRWSVGGAQEVYGILPDLSVWSRALGNGFPIAALVGRRALLELGTLGVDGRRMVQSAATHGPGTTVLAAYVAVADAYARRDVVAVMERQGRLLAEGIRAVVAGHGLGEYLTLGGRASCLTFETRDASGRSSPTYRALFEQELQRRGVLASSFVVSAAHTDEDIAVTLDAVDGALEVYAHALQGRRPPGNRGLCGGL